MAGTNKGRGADGLEPAPAVILVKPQLGENIGMVARAMLNCGLIDLRLVAPRDGWPNANATASASGATVVLDQARVFDTTADALAGLQSVYATTARGRHMTKPVVTPRKAAAEMRLQIAAGAHCGALFGPENFGLDNDDVALADTILTVPLNPGFSSLNLAQAVLLLGYEWYQSGDVTPEKAMPFAGDAQPAEKADLLRLFEHLEAELDDAGFLFPPEKRPTMVRNLRTILSRASLTDQEVRTLRGVIVALSKGRPRRPR
ncbi:MAG: RNA methyltransferase [Magnetospiraceae bacterium]